VAAWHNGYVAPGYVLLALWTGALWFWLIGAGFDAATPQASLAMTALLSLAVIVHKTAYWRALDRMAQPATPESATGLGRLGSVRAFEAPHTEANYLTREMGFRLARKHGKRLRALAATLIAVVVLALLWACLSPRFALGAAIAAVLAGSVAVFIERWLFFAEAKHVVMQYYGGTAG
jgi:DMSO reductase anchor subunit